MTQATDTDTMTATCYFCGRTASLATAISEGWTPDFWRSEGEYMHAAPACAKCQVAHLAEDGDGEMVLKRVPKEEVR